jgi:ATP-dependent DNA helicase RecQ
MEAHTNQSSLTQAELDRALALLRAGVGDPKARFRDGQEEAIRGTIDGRSRQLVVQRTGWGKSFVYFIAAKLLRERGEGPTLLVSPLLALMRNQIAAANRMGVRAVTVNSENADDWDDIRSQLKAGRIDILIVSPERFANDEFANTMLQPIADIIPLVVIDEAHCISDWGHDFRPHYRRLERLVRSLAPSLRVLATTATANRRVIDDLVSVLGPNLEVRSGDLTRDSLTLQAIRLPSQEERLAWLAEHVPQLEGSGIIYALTVADAERVAEFLQDQGIDCEAYTSRSERREELEQALLGNDLKALVATSALGMGFDKPDLGFVIHYQAPGSVVSYYQQVGRAGRAVGHAYGILLSGNEEVEIQQWFIDNAFPERSEVEQLLPLLEAAPNGLTIPQIEGKSNLRRARIQKALDLLALESPAPVVRENWTWKRTSAPLGQSFWDRVARLTERRNHEFARMQQYVELPFGAHMEFLVTELGGDASRVQPPRGKPLPTTVSPEFLAEAREHGDSAIHFIEPRRLWPNGGLPEFGVSGRIPAGSQAETGIALCRWGTGGWPDRVRECKYVKGRFDGDLVAALVQKIHDAADDELFGDDQPAWVTCIPSLRRPTLVPDLARRVAAQLGIPFLETLRQTRERPEQKGMQNGVFQTANLDGSLEVIAGVAIPPGRVLLIDDIVDSRWTMTVAAWLLRSNGAELVSPVALALAGPGT